MGHILNEVIFTESFYEAPDQVLQMYLRDQVPIQRHLGSNSFFVIIKLFFPLFAHRHWDRCILKTDTLADYRAFFVFCVAMFLSSTKQNKHGTQIRKPGQVWWYKAEGTIFPALKYTQQLV